MTLGLGLCIVLVAATGFGEEKATTGELAKQTLDGLKGLVKKGTEKLAEIAKGDVTEVDRSMNDLRETVGAAPIFGIDTRKTQCHDTEKPPRWVSGTLERLK